MEVVMFLRNKMEFRVLRETSLWNTRFEEGDIDGADN